VITVGIYGIPDTTHGCAPTYTHDHSIAVMRAGKVLSVVQLERWTGRKFDNQLAQHIGPILQALIPEDEPVRFVSVNAFVGSSFISADGNLRIEPDGPVRIEAGFTPARVRWYPDGITPRRAEGWIVNHELAHLGSLLPFFGRFPDGALLAHIDGGASDSACSFWSVDQGWPVLRSSSWDRLKAPINNFNVNPLVRAILGFGTWEHLSIPGKLMGYAAMGRPDAEKLAWLAQQGWFLEHPDDPAAFLSAINQRFRTGLTRLDAREPLLQDLCACLQSHFESELVATLTAEAEDIGARTLLYAGGGALNIPTNTRLEQTFEQVLIPPCPNDTGLALGAAALLEYRQHGPLPRHTPYLNRFGTPPEPVSHDGLASIAALLAEGAVVGVCNGAGELGPRALGNRSLLARPDDVTIRRRISEDIKKREWYRPIAPMMTAEVAAQALGPAVTSSNLAPWMLGAWRVQPGWEDAFAGVIHEDGTVRAQVVRPEQEWLHSLLTRLHDQHGIAGLINTSFNIKGQPILHYHRDAVPAAAEMGLDAAVVHGSLHRL
jgi:carbamoyltransferase